MSSGIALENSQPASDEGVEISIESGEQNLSEGIAFDGVFREGVDSDARPAPGEVSLKALLPTKIGMGIDHNLLYQDFWATASVLHFAHMRA